MQSTKQQLEDLVTQIPEKWYAQAIEVLISFMVGQMENEAMPQSKFTSLEKENAKLKEDVAKLQKEKAEIAKYLSEYIENSELNATKARDQAKHLKEQFEASVEKNTREIASLKALNETLRKENEALKRNRDELANKSAESSKLVTLYNNLKLEYEALKEQSSKKSLEANKVAEETIQALRHEIGSLTAQMRNKDAEYRARINDLTLKCQKIETELSNSQAEKRGLLQSFEAINQRLKEMDKLQSASKDNQELNRKIIELKQANEKLASMNEALSANEKLLKSKLEESGKKISFLAEALDRSVANNEKITRESQFEKAQAYEEIGRLEKIVDKLRAEKNLRLIQPNREKEEIDRLVKEVDELEKENEDLHSKNEKLSANLEELKKKFEEANLRLALSDSGYEVIV